MNDQTIEILTEGLCHIKDHMSIVLNGKGLEFSAIWNIANNALHDAGIDTETDNDRKGKE